MAIAVLCVCLAAGAIGYKTMQNPGENGGSTAGADSPAASSLLDVASTPSGAQVFVDSAFKGTTPLNIPMRPGTYEIRLNLPGYYEWEAQLQIGEDQPAPLDVRLVSID
jgi:hypothetical protein